ncbi:MAG TPA: efflux RND transporter periplasmic adaptor subunit [Candidatus Limnocylindrales bacterium]|nr:efflux RND transporter periplasmic adaptor subunit [Candidatus Limnocylindrales bacterium]
MSTRPHHFRFFPSGTGRYFRLPVSLLPGICLSTLLIAGCGAKSAADNPAGGPPPALPVQVAVAQSQAIADTTEYLSILKSRHSATINPQVEGQITKIFVKSGDRVAAGAPLLQIDPLKQEAAVGSQEATRVAQEANVRLAKVSLERAQKLFDAGVISKQEFDNSQTYYDAAVAQLKSLEHQVQTQQVELHYYRVSAPMDGIVGDVPVRVGDRVTVTTLLTTVDEPGALEAYIYVPASRGHDLRLGLPVKLLDPNGTTLTQAELTFVSPQVDPETQTVLAKAAIGNTKARFRIAQQVRAQITWGIRQGVVVPILAVQRINGQFFGFVAEKGDKGTMARQRLLNLGETVGNDYAALEGIHPGDHVIVSGLQFLQDGMPVIEQFQEQQPGPSHGPASDSKPK